MEIKRIAYDRIDFIKVAKKERVTFDNPKNAYWFGLFEGEQLVSVYCLVIAKHKARFKSNYTLPTYRRRGYLTLFIKHAKEICKANGIKEMTAFCTPLSIGSHLKNGAEIKSHKGDIAFIKYII